MTEDQLLEKLRRVVRGLIAQNESLGLLIDSKTRETNHGAIGLTIGTHDISSSIKQIDELMAMRERLRRQLAELNDNRLGYIEMWADALLKSMGGR